MTTYQLSHIPNGNAGTRATLKIMARIARTYRKAPAVRELALSLVKNLPPKKWSLEARAIHNYVRDNIRYTRDIAGCETLQTPIQTLRVQQGDCDDKSVLVAALLGAIGHPVRFVAVGSEKNIFTHVFPQTKIAGKWLTLETTENWELGRTPKNIKAYMVENI